MLALSSTWAAVLASGIGAIQVVAVTIATMLIRSHLKTPSGPTVGAQTEQANALSALAIGYLSAMMERQKVPKPSVAEAVATAEHEAGPIINGESLPQPKGH